MNDLVVKLLVYEVEGDGQIALQSAMTRSGLEISSVCSGHTRLRLMAGIE